jgi:cytochrome c5
MTGDWAQPPGAKRIRGACVGLILAGLSGCDQQPTDTLSAQAIYDRYCFACHNQGAAGAPRLSDRDDWASLLATKGRDGLVQGAISGVKAMPPRGTCNECTDAQIADSVVWMLQQNGL